MVFGGLLSTLSSSSSLLHILIVYSLQLSTVNALVPSLRSFYHSYLKLSESQVNDADNIDLAVKNIVSDENALTPIGSEKSFVARRFIPPNTLFAPRFLSTNCHWQTIIGTRGLQNKIFGNRLRNFRTTMERFTTPDGDFFDVEFTENFESAKALVVISHGLESNAKGEMVSNFAEGFLSKGFGCCLVNYRGCSGEPNL